MIANVEIIDYIKKLPVKKTAPFDALSAEDKAKSIFEAMELLGDYYKPTHLTTRSIALQILFTLESEGEEYARLKRHGIGEMSTKDTTVKFTRSDALAPDVVNILGEPLRSMGSTARLI